MNESLYVLAATRDAELARQVRDEVRPLGPAVTVVTSSADCLATLDVTGPVVLVIDDPDQESTAPALLRCVRTRHPTLPVIFATGRHSPRMELDARRLGVLYYSAKPLRPGVLGRFVEVMSGRTARA